MNIDFQITSAVYFKPVPTATAPTAIKATIDGQELFVPLDPANRHYAEIMRQVDAGELTITEADS